MDDVTLLAELESERQRRLTLQHRIGCVNDVYAELRHNFKVTPDGSVELKYIMEQLGNALAGTVGER